jgi:protocatechuate 3,4-dioxygenase beta subunit
MFATRCKLLVALVLALGVAAGAGALAQRPPAAGPAAAPPPPAKAEQPADQPKPAAIDNDKGDTVAVAGRVLGPDGKPFAGAEITAWWHSHHGWVAWQNSRMHSARPKVLGRSGPDGRFRFTFPKSDIRDSLLNSDAQPWRRVEVIAAAPGHGPAWTYAQAVAQGELTLRLVKDDVPIRGRVRDLEGRPVAGAAVEVVRAADLEVYSWAGLPEKITTDKDGRFTLTGVGRGRSARLLITGPTIEFKVIDVTTPPEKDGKPAAPVTVDVVVGPTKVITGTVRALDTGKPLADVWVYGNEHHYCNTYVVRPVRAMTDKDGRYRLVGLPKAKTYELRVYPAAGQNYLVRDRTVADSEGLKPLRADFELRHGVPIAFRLIEKESGKPVRGHVQYEPTSDNPYRSEAVYAPGVIPAREFMRLRETGADGYVRFVAYPGPCVIFAHAGRGSPPYLHGRLDPADRAKGHFPGPRGDPDNGFLEITNGYARIDYKATDEEQKFDIFFYRGPYLKGRLLGPGGRPVTGATAFGLTRDASAPRPDAPPADEALKTEVFTALGLYPKEPRTLSFVHKENKLIGYVVVDGTKVQPVEVRLQPWGAVTGRLIDGDGKPLAGVKVRRFYPTLPPPGMRANGKEFVTDADGRFRVEGLLPEQKHRLALAGPKEGIKLDAGAALKDVSAPAGRVKDLGDVRVQVQTVPAKKK